ncbi:MAG TPA: hypothetical protein VKQ72_05365, partial [Aggregatilineales bacterium]|nr:hypothetical protein [Aggregatilineales bacterium]
MELIAENAPTTLPAIKLLQRDTPQILHRRNKRRSAGLSILPEDAFPAVLAALQSDAPVEYEIILQSDGYHAVNAAQHLDITFRQNEIAIRSSKEDNTALSSGMHLVGYGYRETVQGVGEAQMQAIDNRMEYRRGNLTEWYINGRLGLEQGFTLYQAPVGGTRGELLIQLAYLPELVPTLSEDRQSITFTSSHADGQMLYGHLLATDAAGQLLPVYLEIADDSAKGQPCLQIVVDDKTALYPIVVDPFIRQATLTEADPADSAYFGSTMAISRDGKTIAVGDWCQTIGSINCAGAVYIFERAGNPSIWKQTAKLVAPDPSLNGDGFGVIVDIDGDTAVIGTQAKDERAYIAVRDSRGWASASVQRITTPSGSNSFGWNVAISGDTILVSDPFILSGPAYGQVYVYVRSNDGTWPISSTPPAINSGTNDAFGGALGISGNTAIVGLSGTNGAAYIFVRPPAGSWPTGSSYTRKLLPSDPSNARSFGTAVAVNGDTAVVGDDGNVVGGIATGAVYVYVRNTDGTWPGTETQKLSASSATATGVGFDVALSGDIIIAQNAHFQSIAYVFTRSGTSWSPHEVQQIAAGGTHEFEQGFRASAINGSLAIIGNFPNRSSARTDVYVSSTLPTQAPDWLMVANAAGAVGRIVGLNSANPTYQPLLSSPPGSLGTAVKLVSDPWNTNQVLLIGSSGILYCSDITVANPTWQTAVSAAVGETYIADMKGSLTSQNYFCWLSHKVVSGTDYVLYNYTTDFFATTHSLQVARYSASMTCGIARSDYNDGKFWVSAGDPTMSDAGVYPITGG